VVALLLPAGSNSAPIINSPQTLTVEQVGNVQPVVFETLSDEAEPEDCLTTAKELVAAFIVRKVPVVTTPEKIVAALGGLITVLTGVKCGRYLGEQNVKLICKATHGPKWFPPSIEARAFVWMITGGQITRCDP